jgi:hypothetical protein
MIGLSLSSLIQPTTSRDLDISVPGHLGTRSWTFRYWPGHLGTRYWTVRDLDETIFLIDHNYLVLINCRLPLLSSVSKHNMWSCYDWVFVVVVRQLTQYVVVLWLGCRCWLPSVNTICGRTDDNDNPTIIQPTTSRDLDISVPGHLGTRSWTFRYWPGHLGTVVVLWLGCRCWLPSVNTICGRIMIGLSLLSSVSKHNKWSYYDWVVVVFRQ